MTHTAAQPPADQTGFVLVTALLLLIVVTLLAASMFRSFGVEEKIAGNVRDKQRALLAAETAQQYAERYLAETAAIPAAIGCTGMTNANLGAYQICNTTLAAPTSLPWLNASSAQVGTTYAPTAPVAMNISTTSAPGTYYATPQFYIAYLGNSTSVTGGVVYQIDAVGYGGSPSSVAVVESTFLVQSSVSCYGGC